jgi:hypothetical protein
MKGSFESDPDVFGLSALLKICAVVSSDFTSISSCLNTAPVTLAALAKECHAVGDVLGRFEEVVHSSPQLSDLVSGQFGDSCHALLNSISSDLSCLKQSAGRIRPRDRDSDSAVTGIDDSASRLIIIWNEDILKQRTQSLRESRISLAFLVHCVQRWAAFNIFTARDSYIG